MIEEQIIRKALAEFEGDPIDLMHDIKVRKRIRELAEAEGLEVIGVVSAVLEGPAGKQYSISLSTKRTGHVVLEVNNVQYPHHTR